MFLLSCPLIYTTCNHIPPTNSTQELMMQGMTRSPSVVSRRITGTIFFSESIFSAALIATVTLLSVNASLLSGTDTLAGLPTTLGLVGRATLAVPMGWLMDRSGRRTGMVLGYSMGVLGMVTGILAVQTFSFVLLCVSTAIIGVNNATSQQARFVAAEVWPPHQRARIIGFIVFAGTVGAVGGPLLVAPTSALAVQLGFEPNAGPYLLGVGLLAISALTVMVFLRPDPLRFGKQFDTPSLDAEGNELASRPMRAIFANHTVQLAVASMVVGQLVMTLIMVITPVHMHHANHSNGEISLVFMAHTLGMFGFAFLTGWLIGQLGALPMIAFGAAVLVISSVMVAVAANLLALVVALFLLGLGWSFCFVAGSSLLTSALHPTERGRVQGANDTLVALASGAGSLSTGAIFASGGMIAIGAVGLGITLVFVAAAAWLNQQRRLPAVEAR
ncbi:MAG TPA: MFS transporter [Caldilinea sp.]|nr:MFS transporter [Caldilinea sp.]